MSKRVKKIGIIFVTILSLAFIMLLMTQMITLNMNPVTLCAKDSDSDEVRVGGDKEGIILLSNKLFMETSNI